MERFKPRLKEEYYYIDSYGGVSSSRWEDREWEIWRYDTGNCFRTDAEARAKMDRDECIASGRARVVDIPEGWEIVVSYKSTPQPPPREAILKVKIYDRRIHGDPDFDRTYYIVSKHEYVYTNETEEL